MPTGNPMPLCALLRRANASAAAATTDAASSATAAGSTGAASIVPPPLSALAATLGVPHALIYRSDLRPWIAKDRIREAQRAAQRLQQPSPSLRSGGRQGGQGSRAMERATAAAAALPASEQCRDYSCEGGMVHAIGNHLGEYAIARAAALAGNLDFLLVRSTCDLRHVRDAQPLLPAAAPAAQPAAPPEVAAAAAVACAFNLPGGTHGASHVWGRYMPHFAAEMRLGLTKWAACAAFPPRDAPLDDIAVHLRCGDALETRHRSYGLLQLAALAEVIPADRPVSVGIVTQPFAALCASATNTSAAASRSDGTGTLHGVRHCACTCVQLLETYVEALQRLRPQAHISVRDQDSRAGSLARLVLAPVASVCQTSTFCLWPVLAASHAHIVRPPPAQTTEPHRKAAPWPLPRGGCCNLASPQWRSHAPRAWRVDTRRRRRTISPRAMRRLRPSPRCCPRCASSLGGMWCCTRRCRAWRAARPGLPAASSRACCATGCGRCWARVRRRPVLLVRLDWSGPGKGIPIRIRNSLRPPDYFTVTRSLLQIGISFPFYI